jgi:hypothetical protein
METTLFISQLNPGWQSFSSCLNVDIRFFGMFEQNPAPLSLKKNILAT